MKLNTYEDKYNLHCEFFYSNRSILKIYQTIFFPLIKEHVKISWYCQLPLSLRFSKSLEAF